MNRIALLAALLTCSTALAAEAVPARPLECASPEVARANANLLEAQAADFACRQRNGCASDLTSKIVSAYVEQKRFAIETTCPRVVQLRPDPIVDPWEPDAIATDGAEAAWWCEVFGDCAH